MEEAAAWQPAEDTIPPATLAALMGALHATPAAVACFATYRSAPVRTWTLAEGAAYLAATPPEDRLLIVIDPSPHAQYPGWPLRNILTCVHVRYALTTIPVLRWRELYSLERVESTAPIPDGWKSMLGTVSLPAGRSEGGFQLVTRACGRPDAAGWERNSSGTLAPKHVSLAAMIDPQSLAERAVDLNLQLMRWRVMPDLALATVQHTQVLLVGAGTLGCHVARTLLAWGVRTVTLVDNGRVSYSNPVRQSLYEFEDCLDGGKPKAQAAADALVRIFPGVHAKGHVLSVPMPGHPVVPANRASSVASIAAMEALVAEHDVVFVLTDSREARWLPSLLGAAMNKLVLNVALGYDSYLVMRHGTRHPDVRVRAGCYFCHDVVAPTDSLSHRTLDQMCTVTRPGLAGIAASTAVELMVSVLQHPQGAAAPPSDTDDDAFGAVPHQVRGSLATFSTRTLSTSAFPQCTACSDLVLAAYERDGRAMVLAACDDAGTLETAAHLDELKHAIDARDDIGSWSDEGGIDA